MNEPVGHEPPVDRTCVVRHPTRGQVDVEPDLLDGIRWALAEAPSGREIAERVRFLDMNRGVAPEHTWRQLLLELFRRGGQPPEGAGDREAALLRVLERFVEGGSAGERWSLAKDAILQELDLLSGWTRSGWRHVAEDVYRENGKYFHDEEGERIQILGVRTAAEERWDFTWTSSRQGWGVLSALLRVIALANICEEYRADPATFPPSARVHLPETDGYSSFLHWQWEVIRPFREKLLSSWRPEEARCDPGWLADDLMVTVSASLGLDWQEREPRDWQTTEEEWRARTEGFPRQLDLSLRTGLHFGAEESAWFEFGDRWLRWINPTPTSHASLVVPTALDESTEDAYEIALLFLSRLAYTTGQSISDSFSVAGSAGYAPRINQPRAMGGLHYRQPPELDLPHDETPDLRLALALFREGLSSGSVYYSFLSYWKIVQLPFREKGSAIRSWVERRILQVRYVRLQQWLDQNNLTPAQAADHLYQTGRNAITHVSRDPRVNPDDPQDRMRIAQDVQVAKGLAELAIRQGLFASQPETDEEE